MTDRALLEPDIVETGQTETALAVRESSPMPVFTGAQMAQAITAYRELQKALDSAMPDQIMDIQGKKFRKKGYWRSVATAFNLTVECVKEERTTSDATADHNSDWGWLVTYRATAHGGRCADGDGSCFASEKNRGRMSATEHNVRSHAHTRAFNRAVSNLVAFGEVSAEELERNADEGASSRAAGGRDRSSHGSSYASEAQGKRLYAIAKQAGWADAELQNWLLSKYGIDSLLHVPRQKYDELCAAVGQGVL